MSLSLNPGIILLDAARIVGMVGYPTWWFVVLIIGVGGAHPHELGGRGDLIVLVVFRRVLHGGFI